MKKILYAFLGLLLVLVIAVGVYCYQNWSIIRIIFLDTETTRANAVETGQTFKSDVQEYIDIDLGEFTPEEEEKIASGELSAAEIIVEKIETASKENPELKKSQENEIIIRYTEKFGALQAKYIGVLEGLIAEGKKEYYSKKYTKPQKTVLLNTYVKKAQAAETSCNGEFEALLSQMEAELKGVGGDLGILDTVRETYENEKAAKEVHYRNKYLSRVK